MLFITFIAPWSLDILGQDLLDIGKMGRFYGSNFEDALTTEQIQ